MTRAEDEARVQKIFDTVAEGYDHPATFWFDQTARVIAAEAQLSPHMEGLDVATGTGKVALALAASEPGARILGIDLSAGMLDQARKKAHFLGLENASFEQGSFDELNHEGRFDVVTCSFGIFFVEHMVETLARLGAQAKAGGRIILSTFVEGSFSPFDDAFLRLYKEFGFEVPPSRWLPIASSERFAQLFAQAKLPVPTIVEHDFGFDLLDQEVWWDIVYNAGYRGFLQRMNEADVPVFKDRHLLEVGDLIRVQGIKRLPIKVLVATSTLG